LFSRAQLVYTNSTSIFCKVNSFNIWIPSSAE